MIFGQRQWALKVTTEMGLPSHSKEQDWFVSTLISSAKEFQRIGLDFRPGFPTLVSAAGLIEDGKVRDIMARELDIGLDVAAMHLLNCQQAAFRLLDRDLEPCSADQEIIGA